MTECSLCMYVISGHVVNEIRNQSKMADRPLIIFSQHISRTKPGAGALKVDSANHYPVDSDFSTIVKIALNAIKLRKSSA